MKRDTRGRFEEELVQGVPAGSHPLYNTWRSMLHRCYNSKRACYSRYGGRGIDVCERWRTSFENFVEDMGDKPEGCTLDRIDGRKGYFPENCRWASSTEQAMNRSDFKNNKIKQRNISLHKGMYGVRFRRNKVIVYEKWFKTLEEAVKDRDAFLEEENGYT